MKGERGDRGKQGFEGRQECGNGNGALPGGDHDR